MKYQPAKVLRSNHALWGVVCGVAMGMIGVSFYLADSRADVTPVVDNQVVESQSEVSDARPLTIEIPAINLNATFTAPLGLEASGEIEVPAVYEEVGWYRYSPTAGEIGPMIVLGHVDSVNGPAVFWSLGQLESGDEISITQEDGTEVTYIVEYSEKYDQDEFPTDLVYGDTDYPALRLITCSGIFDRGVGRYTHNRVVYARLATSADTEIQ